MAVYTRIRNFGAVQYSDGTVACPDATAVLENVGDVNGDGVDEIATRFAYNGELIIDGTLPASSLVDAAHPTPGRVTVVGDDLEAQAVGDINGDGRTDWYLYSDADAPRPFDDCVVLAGPAGGLRARLDAEAIADDVPLARLPRREYGDCPRIDAIGDVNSDGFDDLSIAGGFNEAWIVHGRAAGATIVDPSQAGYPVYPTCCREPFDVDADGFADVLLDISNVSQPQVGGADWLIAYGGPDGLPTREDVATLPVNRVTQIVQREIVGGFGRHTAEPRAIGDLNGDGANELFIPNYSSFDTPRPRSILYGTPGHRPAVLLESSIDGGNGTRWLEDNDFWAIPAPGDLDGDGYDDLTYLDRFIHGTSPLRRAADPGAVLLLHGPDSIDIHWEAPEDDAEVAAYAIAVNDVIVSTLPVDERQVRLPLDDEAAALVIAIRSLDALGNRIGEAVREVIHAEPELRELLALTGDVESTVDGTIVPAADYTLTGASYGPDLGELFWNATKRFVLVWKDGEIIDRTEGNSYMVHGDGGEYFITIDYLGALPAGGAAIPQPDAGTLRRSNIVTINVHTSPVESAVTVPARLRATVYSATAAELFWERAAAGDAIVAYEIARDDTSLGRTEGTSFFDDSRMPGQAYEYAVVAIDTAGRRSAPAVVSTAAFGDTAPYTPPTTAPTLPLTGTVYSPTALELFWDRDAIADLNPVRFDIVRDGQSVVTLDARSYFTDRLSPATTSSFQVIALNAAGQVVAESEVLTLTTR